MKPINPKWIFVIVFATMTAICIWLTVKCITASSMGTIVYGPVFVVCVLTMLYCTIGTAWNIYKTRGTNQ